MYESIYTNNYDSRAPAINVIDRQKIQAQMNEAIFELISIENIKCSANVAWPFLNSFFIFSHKVRRCLNSRINLIVSTRLQFDTLPQMISFSNLRI